MTRSNVAAVEAAEMFLGVVTGMPVWIGALGDVVAELPDAELKAFYLSLVKCGRTLLPEEKAMGAEADSVSDEQLVAFRARVKTAVLAELNCRGIKTESTEKGSPLTEAEMFFHLLACSGCDVCGLVYSESDEE